MALQLYMQLVMLKKNGLPAMDYFSHVKGLTDNLAAAWEPLREDEIVTFLLIGLPEEYNSLVTLVTSRAEPMSLSDVYTNMLSFETHQMNRQAASNPTSSPLPNYASRGGRGGHSGAHTGGRTSSHGGGHMSGRSNGSGDHSNDRPRCQICGHANHRAPQCWYCYDDGYQKDEKPSTALASMSSYSMEVPWYSNTGSTYHITSPMIKSV
jgi:hypothetical protein